MEEPSPAPLPAPIRRSAWLVALDTFLLLAVVILPLAWFFDPLAMDRGFFHLHVSWGWKPITAPVVLLVLRQVVRRKTGRRGLAEAPLYRKLALAVLSSFVTLFLLETVLTRAGVNVTGSAPIVIAGNEAEDTVAENNVMADPELLWRFVPNTSWDDFRINSEGYRTHAFAPVKPAGQRRVIALGDSCTAQGHPPYSEVLHALLQKKPPTAEPWEAFNMGVYGYSSMQGLRQFEKCGAALRPDVVTIYYGWNDHWLHTTPDHLRMAVRQHVLVASFTHALQKKRLYTVLAGLTRRNGAADDKPGQDYRVPSGMYRATLTELVRQVREAGALPILLTAPRRALTEDVVHSHHARSVEEVERVHDEYVAITREVAAAEDAPLLDLAAQFADARYDQMFLRDGIHFEQSGLQAIAAAIHEKLLALGAQGQLARK